MASPFGATGLNLCLPPEVATPHRCLPKRHGSTGSKCPDQDVSEHTPPQALGTAGRTAAPWLVGPGAGTAQQWGTRSL